MMKYKLIKEYPGSPELGTVVEEKCKTSNFYMFNSNAVLRSHVEDNPKYWEKVNENLWYVVSNRDYQEGNMLFQEWFIYSIETCFPKDNGVLLYFKTKEEAEEYVFYNKPCLSYSDVKGNIHVGYSTESILKGVYKTVKSKL